MVARVVIIGAGFGGLAAARALRHAPAEVTVLDRENHQCFQPLLYQVATAALTPADIAWPIRTLLRGQDNTRALMSEVRGVDLAGRRVLAPGGPFVYDWLIVASGATHAYFGHDEWAPFAPGLKRVEDATDIRRRLLLAFEKAELSSDAEQRRALTTFVVVGGGPTGVELAGAISDMARQALPPDFHLVDPADTRVLLIEAGPRILPAFPDHLSATARSELEASGVEVITGRAVTNIDEQGVTVGAERIACGAVVWAAGGAASAAADWLGADRDRAGRVIVGPDLSLPGHPEVFVIGDTALARTPAGAPVPGIAPAAKQMGRYVGRRIEAALNGGPAPPPFAYRHEGDLATIGRNAAVVRIGRFSLTGFLGWAFWSLAHIYFLIGVRNRIAVAFSWAWDYLTFGRRSRLIIGPMSEEMLSANVAAEPRADPAPTGQGAPSPGARIWS
jgi:NADH dehydrogenase